MISNFALLLSQEGITLAHRTADGWVALDQADINDPELPDALGKMRELAIEKGGVDFTTKLVLPEDQVKYLDLPPTDDDTRDEVVKDALESSTPYLIDELAFDWEDDEDGVKIAAVARDTLAEAESFATQFGLNPASFVASPDDETFSVEPFFGTTNWVTNQYPEVDSTSAELSKVVLIAPDAPADEDPANFDDGEGTDESAAPETVEATDEISSELKEHAPEIDESEVVVEHAEPEPEPEPEKADAPAKELPQESSLESEDTPQSDEQEEKHSEPPTIIPLSESDDDVSDDIAPPRLGGASRDLDASTGSGFHRAPRVGFHAEQDEDVLDRSFPKWAGGSRRVSEADPIEDDTSADIDWLSKQEQTDDSVVPESPPSWMGEKSIHEEDDENAERPSWIPTAKPQSHPLLYDQLNDEAEQMEVFGNRKDQREDRTGFPLVWVAIIAVVFIILAGGVLGIRALLSDDPEPEIAITPPVIEDVVETPVELADPASEDPDPSPETTAEVEPELVTPVPAEAAPEFVETTEELANVPSDGLAPEFDSAADAPVESVTQPNLPSVGEAETALETPQPVQPLTEAPVEAEESEQASQTTVVVTPELETEAEAEPPAVAMAPLRPGSEIPSLEEVSNALPEPRADLLIGAAQNWETLSEDARLARYAATGIWPVAPAAPEPTSGEAVGDIFLTSIDPVVFTADAYAITPSAEMLSDKALTAMPNPPAPGTVFERDERGLILATPEGAVTPDGITVYASIPPQIPPLAPRPDPIAEADAQRAALQGKIPRLRPDIAPESPSEEEAAEVEGIATGGPSNQAPLRPAAIAALAAEPEIVNPLALTSTPAPRLRPGNFSQIIYATERAAIAAQTTTAVAPSRANVGQAATEENVLSLRGISLIGIYGEAGDRRALIRLNNGRYQKIEVGDRVDGGNVTAIDQDKVFYVKRGQSYVLELP